MTLRTPSAHLTRALVVAAFLLTLKTTAFPQAGVLGENCDLSVVGAETKSFLAFDRELRQALSKQDAGMMALLVKYPLRVNDGRGSYYLHDAASLQPRFQEIFTPALRDTILKQRPETVWCNYSGIMYGDGVVWVNPTGQSYAIETVNVPNVPPSPGALKAGRVVFVCNADKHRVIVDAGADEKLRYRAWNKPRSLTEKPDIEVSQGKEERQGTGPCAYTIWKFASASAEFDVEELSACCEDNKKPPEDAKGSLSVSLPNKQAVSWWCR